MKLSGIKLVVVVNQELGMPKGKLARQVLGAGMRVSHTLSRSEILRWKLNSEKAVVLKTTEYNEIKRKLISDKVEIRIMIDAGRTFFKEPTETCLAFFCSDNEFDYIEELKLL